MKIIERGKTELIQVNIFHYKDHLTSQALPTFDCKTLTLTVQRPQANPWIKSELKPLSQAQVRVEIEAREPLQNGSFAIDPGDQLELRNETEVIKLDKSKDVESSMITNEVARTDQELNTLREQFRRALENAQYEKVQKVKHFSKAKQRDAKMRLEELMNCLQRCWLGEGKATPSIQT